MAKMEITFGGFKDLAYRLDKMGGDLKTAVNEALEETQNIVQSNVENAAARLAIPNSEKKRTGKMYQAIRKDKNVEWHGDVASVKVGFDLSAPHGFHSIFVMYGTPRYEKDRALYNAIKGKATQEQIAKKQEEIMKKYLSLGD